VNDVRVRKTGPEIRRLTPADLRSYRQIWLEGATRFPKGFLLSPEEIAAIADRDHVQTLAAGRGWGLFENHELVSMAVLRRCGPKRLNHVADLGPLVTRPSAQGRGFGRQLLEHLLAQARAEGILQIELCVDEENVPALSLYRSLGFQQIGRRPRSLLIDGITRNDLILQRCLDQD